MIRLLFFVTINGGTFFVLIRIKNIAAVGRGYNINYGIVGEKSN
jgi:hypothetical protein